MKIAGQWPKLEWGPNWLLQTLSHFLDSLEPAEVCALTRYLSQEAESLRWGSSCSGTESPGWVFRDLWIELQRRAPDQTLCPLMPVVCAEASIDKCNFIKKACPAKAEQMYLDMKDLLRRRAFCLKRGERRVPDISNLHFFLAGFSCKSVSGLACSKEGAGQCLMSDGNAADYQTADTFGATTRIIKLHKPKLIALENVLGLRQHDQHLLCMQRLRKAGYVMSLWEVHSIRFGLPQDRKRLWFLGIHEDVLKAFNCSEDQWLKMVEHVMSRIMKYKQHQVVKLDSFLLGEDDQELEHERSDILARYRAGALSGSTGPGGAMSQNSKGLKLKQERECGRLVSSHWSDDLIHLFPTFLKLSEREKSMLDAKGMRFPDPSGKVMSVAQQNSTLSFGHTGCLVPTNVVWLGERGRLLRGCEMLRLQGVFISRSLEQEFPNALLADLAGNAFSTPCAAAAILTGLIGLAGIWSQHCAAASLVDPPRSISPVAAADDEKVDDSMDWLEPPDRYTHICMCVCVCVRFTSYLFKHFFHCLFRKEFGFGRRGAFTFAEEGPSSAKVETLLGIQNIGFIFKKQLSTTHQKRNRRNS